VITAVKFGRLNRRAIRSALKFYTEKLSSKVHLPVLHRPATLDLAAHRQLITRVWLFKKLKPSEGPTKSASAVFSTARSPSTTVGCDLSAKSSTRRGSRVRQRPPEKPPWVNSRSSRSRTAINLCCLRPVYARQGKGRSPDRVQLARFNSLRT